MSKPDFEVRLLLVVDKILCGKLVKNRSTSFAKMRILTMMMAMDSWGRGTNGKDACRGDDGHTDDVVDLTWKPSPRSLVSGISPEISGSGPGVSGTANGICDDDDDHECDDADYEEGGVDKAQ